MKKSEQVDQLAAALAKAQGEMQNPHLDETAEVPTKSGGGYTYRYVSLAALRNAVLPVLAKHGLSVLQFPGTSDRGPTLTTLLLHASGQWVESDPLMIPVSQPTAQGYGSALTYARRYALQAVAGVVGEEDDDGQAATQQAAPARRKSEQAAPGPAAPKKGKAPPADGAELQTRLKAKEALLVADGLCQEGELLAYVLAAGKKVGYPPEIVRWPVSQVRTLWKWVVERVKEFEAARQQPAQPAGAAS